ncbi:MAG: glycosyltransferase family 9 protein [Bacteroidota bacterium]
MKIKQDIKRIIISRTDSIGDVVLTLPLAGALKKKFPGIYIIFLGKSYTRAVVQCCPHIDRFLDLDEFRKLKESEICGLLQLLKADAILHVFPNKEIARYAKKAKIPVRIGTSHRLFHWNTCNYRINFTRKNSLLHESQLNFHLLSPLGITEIPSMDEVQQFLSFQNSYTLPEKWKTVFHPGKKKIILHPKSKGSAREWSLENYSSLIHLLPKDEYQVFVSGTEEEKTKLSSFLQQHKKEVTDITGQLSLNEFIAFINACDVLVAASTGPLHIAAALSKKAIGIYPPMRPIHPGRWKPLGQHAVALSIEKTCNDCKRSGDCRCVNEVTSEMVVRKITVD